MSNEGFDFHPDDTYPMRTLKVHLCGMAVGNQFEVSMDYYSQILFGDDNDLPDHQGYSRNHRYSLLLLWMEERSIRLEFSSSEGERMAFIKDYPYILELRTR